MIEIGSQRVGHLEVVICFEELGKLAVLRGGDLRQNSLGSERLLVQNLVLEENHGHQKTIGVDGQRLVNQVEATLLGVIPQNKLLLATVGELHHASTDQVIDVAAIVNPHEAVGTDPTARCHNLRVLVNQCKSLFRAVLLLLFGEVALSENSSDFRCVELQKVKGVLEGDNDL